jgi:hypothetical protein
MYDASTIRTRTCSQVARSPCPVCSRSQGRWKVCGLQEQVALDESFHNAVHYLGWGSCWSHARYLETLGLQTPNHPLEQTPRSPRPRSCPASAQARPDASGNNPAMCPGHQRAAEKTIVTPSGFPAVPFLESSLAGGHWPVTIALRLATIELSSRVHGHLRLKRGGELPHPTPSESTCSEPCAHSGVSRKPNRQTGNITDHSHQRSGCPSYLR